MWLRFAYTHCGLPWWLSGKESTCQGRGCGFDPWVKKIQMVLVVKNLPPMQETLEAQVPSLGREDHLEKEMATHCSILAWRISWTEEPGVLQSIGSHRVGHDWSDLACMQRRKRQPTPVFLPGKSYGQSCLSGYSPWGCKSRTRISN